MEKNKRTEVLFVRMSPNEKQAVSELAAKLSLGVSDLARLSLRETIQKGSISILPDQIPGMPLITQR